MKKKPKFNCDCKPKTLDCATPEMWDESRKHMTNQTKPEELNDSDICNCLYCDLRSRLEKAEELIKKIPGLHATGEEAREWCNEYLSQIKHPKDGGTSEDVQAEGGGGASFDRDKGAPVRFANDEDCKNLHHGISGKDATDEDLHHGISGNDGGKF